MGHSEITESRRMFLRRSGATVATVLARPHLVFAQRRAAQLRLGCVISLSGNFAYYGEQLKRGIELASERINESGGVQIGDTTYKIAVQYYDDKTNATTAARFVERAITNDRQHMVLAPLAAVLVKASIPVAQRLRFPVMTNWAQNESVFGAQKGDPWLFSTLNGFSLSYKMIIEMISRFDNPKVKKVAIISPNDELGVRVVKEWFPADLKQHGLSLADAELYPAGTQEYVGALARIMRTQPDGVVVNAYTPDIIGIFKELQGTKSFPAFLVVEAPTRLYETLGPALNGTFVPIPWDATLTGTKDAYFGTSGSFARLYRDKYKEDVTDFVAPLGAHNVVTYVEVLQTAGAVDDPNKIHDAFRRFDGETFFSRVSFDDMGLNSKGVTYPGQWQAGKVVLVYPPQVASSKPIHPFPLWSSGRQ